MGGRRPGDDPRNLGEFYRRYDPMAGFAGVDQQVAIEEMIATSSPIRCSSPPQPDPIRDHVIPQSQRIGLISDRTAPRYRELGFAVR